MRVTLTTPTGQIVILDVLSDEEVLNIKVLAQVETNIPFEQIQILHHGRELLDNEKINQLKITESDILTIQRKIQTPQPKPFSFDINALASNIAASLGTTGKQPGNTGRHVPQVVPPRPQIQPHRPVQPASSTDPDVFRSYVNNDPNLLQQLLHNDRDLAEAVLSEDNLLLKSILEERARQRAVKEQERIAEIEHLNADPFNLEAQATIENKIREENVLENMEVAMEHHPESFGRVVMLYVQAVVNGVPIQAFVDSGAQQTIMSVECAQRCGYVSLNLEKSEKSEK